MSPAALSRLEISSLATIERLDLPLGAGLVVFTGETGAGKSIVIDALDLLLGGRGRPDLLRRGAERLEVRATWADGFSLERHIPRSGRGAAKQNGKNATQRVVAEAAAARLSVHGQHAALRLLSAHAAARLLNGTLSESAPYHALHKACAQLATELNEMRPRVRENAARLQLLQEDAAILAEAALRPNEDDQLVQRRAELVHQESVQAAALHALEECEGEGGALEHLRQARRSLEKAARWSGGAAEASNGIVAAAEKISDALPEIRRLAEALDDGSELARIEERLATIEQLKERHGPTLNDVLRSRRRIEEEMHELEDAQHSFSSNKKRLKELLTEKRAAAATLFEAQKKAAPTLEKALLAHIHRLGMPHARLQFALQPPDEDGNAGGVELRFSANLGEALMPLAEAVSGGELSRVMLAISLVLGAETPVVIFDEIDAGIGGEAAWAVAEALSELAERRQVLVVTHLAQIAAHADQHHRVQKAVDGGRTVSQVQALGKAERERELARMLSGQPSAAALEHARDLLARAASFKRPQPAKGVGAVTD